MEQRLIDANNLARILEQWKKDCPQDNNQDGAAVLEDVIYQLDDEPNVDIELLPPVIQLRNRIKMLEYALDITQNGEKNWKRQYDLTVQELSDAIKRLKKAERERDEAVNDLRGCAIESYAECTYCLYNTARSFCGNCQDGSNWRYRGFQGGAK